MSDRLQNAASAWWEMQILEQLALILEQLALILASRYSTRAFWGYLGRVLPGMCQQ